MRPGTQQIIDLAEKGHSLAEIAVMVGCSQRRVSRVKLKHGLAKGPTPITGEELAIARRLLEDGASYTEVARTLGRASSTVKRHFPGYTWTGEQAAEYARLRRTERELTG